MYHKKLDMDTFAGFLGVRRCWRVCGGLVCDSWLGSGEGFACLWVRAAWVPQVRGITVLSSGAAAGSK